MSLIDEALKRAQEATRQAGGQPEARPWAPAPLPDAGLARRRRFVRVLAWGISATAALVAGGLLVRAVWNASAPEPSRAVQAAVVPSPAPTLAETVVTTPMAPAAAAGPAARPRPTSSTPATTERPAEPAGSSPAEVPATPAPPRAFGGRNYRGAVDLPGGGRIELGGIVWSEEEPRALLNDRIVGTDAYVEGYTVTKIEENRVVLEKDGVTISISVK